MAAQLKNTEERLIVIVPKDLKREFQIQCLKEDKTMTEKLIELLNNSLKPLGS